MAIVSKVQFQVLTVAEAEQWSIDQWAQRLKDIAERMNEGRKARIVDVEAYKDLLAGPAIIGYQPVVSATFVSRSGLDAADIRASFNAKLKHAFRKYNDKLDFLFEEVDGVPAKRFKELVDQAKEAYSRGVARLTLPFTGSSRSFTGISKLAGMWLTDDPRTESSMRGGDQILIGGPKRICTQQAQPSIRSELNYRLIQSGSLLVKQEWDATAIAKQNDLTNAVVSGLRDAGLNIVEFTTGGESHVNWLMIDSISYLEIQVGVTP